MYAVAYTLVFVIALAVLWSYQGDRAGVTAVTGALLPGDRGEGVTKSLSQGAPCNPYNRGAV